MFHLGQRYHANCSQHTTPDKIRSRRKAHDVHLSGCNLLILLIIRESTFYTANNYRAASFNPVLHLFLRQCVHLLGMSTAQMGRFQELAFTPLVKDLQVQHGSRRQYQRMEQSHLVGNALGPDEQAFIQLRDSFYMATVSETGWPYVQHRGGPKGFVHVISPELLGFADLRGNKQYISTGNLQHDSRVALFFMDYPHQTRLKILGHVEIHEHDSEAPALIKSLRPADSSAVVERAILIRVEGFDWNCPQNITPRFTADEIQEALAPIHQKLADLETENAALRGKLALAVKTGD